MIAAAARTTARNAQVERVATHLLPRASLLTRLLLTRGGTGLSRTEAGILSALEDAPQRITALARGQGLAQPTVTQVVARMEQRGLLARAKDPADGRVVLVADTAAGREAMVGFRESYRAILREHLAARPDADVAALAAATELLLELAEEVQA